MTKDWKAACDAFYWRTSADSFYHKHKAHVMGLIYGERNSIKPSGSDLYRPELWKSIHWVWFLSNYDEIMGK